MRIDDTELVPKKGLDLGIAAETGEQSSPATLDFEATEACGTGERDILPAFLYVRRASCKSSYACLPFEKVPVAISTRFAVYNCIGP